MKEARHKVNIMTGVCVAFTCACVCMQTVCYPVAVDSHTRTRTQILKSVMLIVMMAMKANGELSRNEVSYPE